MRKNVYSSILIAALAIAVAALVFSVTAAGQNQPTTEIKHVPITATSAASGAEMFKNYCAACHGANGTGTGPAASALKTLPSNLTSLAQTNGGKYPTMKVAAILRGEASLPAAHGSREMPIWGNLFWSLSGGHQGEVEQRIANLNSYIESLQK
jgi:mono/diheme cytochrome c family protein